MLLRVIAFAMASPHSVLDVHAYAGQTKMLSGLGLLEIHDSTKPESRMQKSLGSFPLRCTQGVRAMRHPDGSCQGFGLQSQICPDPESCSCPMLVGHSEVRA